MSIMVKGGGGSDFLPCPEGQHAIRCCDVRDLGMVESSFQGKTKALHKILLTFVTDEEMDDGRPFLLFGRYTASLHEKSTLRKVLQSWLGRGLTPEELADGYDVERLVGQPAFCTVLHNESKGNTYANIETIMALPKGQEAPAIPEDFVRFVDREKNAEALEDCPI
jgi:hypothetical protein